MRRTLHQADRHNILFLASALTFDALLAAVPFLLLLLVGLTHVAQKSAGASAADLSQLFDRFLPPHTAVGGRDPFEVVESFLADFTRARVTISLYALPLFLWFSTRLFASVRTALTLVYDVPRRPEGRHFVLGYLAAKLRDAGMVILTLVLLTANTIVTTAIAVVKSHGRELLTGVRAAPFFLIGLGAHLTQFVASLFTAGLFYVVYRHASPRRLPRQSALVASVFTAVLFDIAKRLFSWYLRNLAAMSQLSANRNIGALILFVVWLYYTALVFLIGAVVAESWDLRLRTRREALDTGTTPRLRTLAPGS